MKNNVEKYPDAQEKPLSVKNQIAILLCFKGGFESHHTAEVIASRLHGIQASMEKRNVWHSVKTDLSNQVPLPLVLIKSGFFEKELETIFLVLEDQPVQVINTGLQFLDSYFSAV